MMGCFITKTMYQLNMDHSLNFDDLQQFVYCVSQLFAWHIDGNHHYNYATPYVTLVKMSGMGKMKLIYDLKAEMSRGEASKLIANL